MSFFRAVGDWVDERTGYREGARAWLEAPGIDSHPGSQVLGAAVATCFVLLVVTGGVLMTSYSPSPQSAWASVHYIQFVQENGWILRGVHYWAAQTMLVLAVAHIVFGVFVAAYKPSREIGWWITLLVLGLVVAQGITGGLLPWDQRGWWARVVEGNILGLAPIAGGFIQQMMLGGPELGAIGLSRAYAAHVLLVPLLFAGALWARHALLRRESSRADAAPRLSQLARAILVGLGVTLVVFAITGAFHGAPLDGPADPMSDYPARPEWFLMPLYQLRKFFHGPMEFYGTTLLPGAAGLFLALVPWIDRPPRSRLAVTVPVAVIFGVAIGMGVAATVHDGRDPHYVKARARADGLAADVAKLAMGGVAPSGPLETMRRDPELRGRDLYERHCASCHVLGDLGDAKKSTASRLDGWGTTAWIEAMMHEPDADHFFGRGPFKGEMPSVDVRPRNIAPTAPWSPSIKSPAELHATAVFLSAQGDEPDDPPHPKVDAATRALGEKIVKERCTECHLLKGDGDDDGTGIAPELIGYGSLAWTREQIANPSSFKTYRSKALAPELKRHMPRFDSDLSPVDVEMVARWTRLHARATSFK